MATIITRETGATAKGSPLTNLELDNNFINLNTELGQKLPLAGGTMTGAITFAAGQTWPTFNQNTTGSAATLTTGRTIGMTGDVTWTSAAFNGSGNVTGTATLANSGVTAGTYGNATNIPQLTVDAKGRITGVTNTAVSIPSGSLTFTGDVTGTGTTGASTALTLANSGVTAGAYGSASAIPIITVDAKGRVTALSTAAIDLSTKLNLSGGTMTGAITFAAGQTWPTFNQNTTGSAATLTTARTINGVSFNGSANINVPHDWVHSDRDFPNGTLIQTTIDYSVTNGDPWVLEIRGNSYGNLIPFEIQYQGYIYYDTVISHGGYSVGTSISGLVLFNYNGKLCFWFPNQSYWQGYYVKVYSAYATYPVNRVTTITNVVKPSPVTKEVTLSANIRQVLHSSNYNSYSPTLTGTGASGSWGISVTGNAATVTNGVYTNTSSTLSGDNYLRFGPNSSWNAYLRVGGNGRVSTTDATVATTNGNLHLDSANGSSIYLNYYAGGSVIGPGGATMLHSSNYTTYSPSLTGTGASGTWGISITGSAGSVSGLTLTSSANGINPDNVTQNQLGYNTSISLFGQTDGGLYSSVHSSSWIHQIYGDFRTGQIATRGKNNGTWQAWRTVVDSSNVSYYAHTISTNPGTPGPGVLAIGNNGSYSFVQSHSGQSLNLNPIGNAVNIAGNTALHAGNYSSYALPISGGTVGDLRTNFISGSGGHSFSANHYSMGKDYANGGWSHPHYSDLIIGYHTGIRIGGSYSGVRFYNNSPTTDANNDGNGDSGEALLMTIGGYVGSTGQDVNVNNTIYAAHYRGNANVGGTGEASHHPAGIYSNGTNWLYGTIYTNGNTVDAGGTTCSLTATRANRANGNFYIDDNYGYGIVGAYNASRYQGVFAMGDAYKLPADGTSTGGLYGMAWSHPNAGGAAGNLTDHGLLIINNGVFKCAISNSIVASGNITAYSDERLKKNWRDMPESYVSRLAKVKVGIYDRIDEENGTQVGVSAQSLQTVLPEAIITANDDMKTLSVNYGGAALASAVELAKDNVELRRRIEKLEAVVLSLLNKE